MQRSEVSSSKESARREFAGAGCVAPGVAALAGMLLLVASGADGPLRELPRLLLRVGFWGAILFATARIAAWAIGSRLRGLAHLTWDGAAGLPILFGAQTAIGLLPGGFRRQSVWGLLTLLLIAAAVIAWRDTVSRFRRAGAPSRATQAFGVMVSVVAFAGLAWNRVPPLFFDTLAYHFAQPELWLIQGRIAPEVWSLHSWFPPGMSVLYGIGMGAGGPTWANDANLLVGLLLLGLVFDLGRRWYGDAGGLAAAALLVALPIVTYALAVPAADLAHGTFAAAALGALMLRRDSRDPRWSRRAGWLAAGAVMTKYLGLLVPLFVGAAWLVARRRSAGTPRHGRLGDLVGYVGPSLLLLLPWLAANTIVTGNPVAPVLAGVVATTGLADGGAASFAVDARGGFPSISDARLLGPRLFSGDDDESRIYPTPAWGWTPLALLPAVLLALGRESRVRHLIMLIATLFGLWFVTFRWERFLIAVSALLALALAGSATAAWKRGGVHRAIPLVGFLVGATVLFQSWLAIDGFTGAFPVARGTERAEAFLERSFATIKVYNEANRRLDPSVNRILLLGEMRHYGLEIPRAAPTGFNTHPLALALARGVPPESVGHELRRLGYSHLIVDVSWVRRSAARYPSLSIFREDPDLLEACLKTLGIPLTVQGQVAIFELPG